jgi:hypothetical protein
MMRWLRAFFYSDDPQAKVASGVSEPEVGMLRELLRSNGIRSFAKNMDYLSVAGGAAGVNNFDVWVKRSDLPRARELLREIIDPAQLVEDAPDP